MMLLARDKSSRLEIEHVFLFMAIGQLLQRNVKTFITKTDQSTVL